MVTRVVRKLEAFFELPSRGSTVPTEMLAGLTTFLTMAYIVVVNPLILGEAGMPVPAVAVATCVAAAIGCILMGLVTNYPLAMAPGMGLNAYFAYTVTKAMGVAWPTALGCVFLSGFAFLVLTLVGVRQKILAAMPRSLFAAVAGGIGLFIAFIGLADAGIVVAKPGTLVGLGNLGAPAAMTACLGLAVMASLHARRIPGAILIGIAVSAGVGWMLGLGHGPAAGFSLATLSGTAFHLDVRSALGVGGSIGVSLIEIVFVFLFVDVFDNIGTLVAVTRRAGLMRPDGSVPGLDRILIVDSIAMMAGAVIGTSPVTSYVESGAGVSAGGRSGLTSVVVGVLFIATIFCAPVIQAVPSAAVAPALIRVGALMVGALGEVEWNDPLEAVPAFLTVVLTPLTYSIANGVAFGIIAHAVLRVTTGRVARDDWFLIVLAALFAVRFAYLA